MSDVLPCPVCKKYIDTTFGVDVCPKCGTSLEGVELTNSEPVTDEELAGIDAYLVGSLVSMIFCCPLGLVAVCFSLLTLRDKKRRNYSDALSHSELAKKWLIAALIIGGILLALGTLGRFSEK